MTSRAEDVIFANLTDADALDALVREGIDLRILPTEEARPVVQWVIEQFFDTGRIAAPSADIIREEWGKHLEQNGISLGDGTETEPVEVALNTLKDQYAHFAVQSFLKTFGSKMAKALPPDRCSVLDAGAAELLDISLALSKRAGPTDSATAFEDAMRRYLKRQAEQAAYMGLTFGLEPIDNQTFGIHPGELAVLAAGPKVGKSWFCALVALHEAMSGRKVVLFTLENSAQMTWDRIICLGAKVPYRKFQRGQMDRIEEMRVHEFGERIRAAGNLRVVMPDIGKRTVQHMVRQAQVYESDSLIIDQLTFIEATGNKSRWETIRDITHELKTLISTGRRPIPCLLAHQINREGVKQALSKQSLEMHHLAEGSEVERTADWVFGVFQSDEMRERDQAKIQTLASRREDTVDWMLGWKPSEGAVQVTHRIDGNAAEEVTLESAT